MIGLTRFRCSRCSFCRPRRGTRRWDGRPLVLACALFAATPLGAQAPPEDGSGLRSRALELSKQGNQAEALPLLERVAAARPDDIAVLESLGDALMREGRTVEARARYMDAVVADPYQRASWAGLQQWAKATHATIQQPNVGPPGSMSVGADGKIKLNPKSLDKKQGDEVWMTYVSTRAVWRSGKFKKEFPNETAYRHSLAEEVDALQTVAASVAESAKDRKKRQHLDRSLLTLVELRDQGMLAPYVLFARADDGIAKDYPAYRDAHPDKVRLYLLHWVISTEGNP